MFELGLFMGRLGPKRTFVFYDSSAGLKIMSDLQGVGLVPYDGHRLETDYAAAIGAACEPIRRAIEESASLPVPDGSSTATSSSQPRVRKNTGPIRWINVTGSGDVSKPSRR